MIKVAFGSVPKDSGTFSFYRTLRPALLSEGIDLRCVSVGRDQADLTIPAFVDDGCVQLAARSLDLKRQARAFAGWCDVEAIDIVFGVNSPAILSALPHLPQTLRVMARCANGFHEGYQLTLIGRERVARIVALAPRLRDDLVDHYGADHSRIVIIPNGTSIERFASAANRARGSGEHLELGFLGRLEHKQKGVLHLPAILDNLDESGTEYRLNIAGQGRDEAALRSRLSSRIETGNVRLVGPLMHDQIPDFLGAIDVFLFPSHFEGCPNALLEAMSAGAVPLSWRLQGITDFLIDDEKTGYLLETGDVSGLACRLAYLSENREVLAQMSKVVAEVVRARFSRGICTKAYVDLLNQVISEPEPPWQPVPWSEFNPDPVFRQHPLARFVPASGRKRVRALAGRIAARRPASPAIIKGRTPRVHQIINGIDLERGGAQKLVRELHEGLNKADFESHLVAIEPFAHPNEAPEGAVTFGLKSPYDPRAILSLANYASSILPGDLVHAHLFPTSAYVASLSRAGVIRAPIVLTEHSSSNRRRSHVLGNLIDRQIYGSFDKIVAISEGVRDELLRSRPWINGATTVIPNGCRLLFEKPIARNAGAAPLRIVSVGRLVPAKNYAVALNAIARLKRRDVRYVIAGEGSQRAVLEKQAEELGIGNVVEFAGHVSGIKRFLEEADVFLMTSAWEGFGLAAVEAMNASLALIASDVPGLAEVVGKRGETAMLVDHTDAVAISEAIEMLADDPGLRQKMGLAGFERAKNYDIESFLRLHLRLYEEVKGQ